MVSVLKRIKEFRKRKGGCRIMFIFDILGVKLLRAAFVVYTKDMF